MGSEPKTAGTGTREAARAPTAGGGAAAGYTVLARRYRSRDFDELVGQEPIARTLKNAVESGRTAHAYLFCGSRGVGKTSMARILARALNAPPHLAQAAEIADAILRGDDLDVIEIDGASNRGINEVRDLIENAVLSPARCPYKIYIIDEVHQVTTAAFNALLKTMEEPPAHVKFILCTTEPQKVPATIQSRCQRFDFRLLSTAEIAGQLRDILSREGVAADDAVLNRIARLGRGSMRDALSLLDRLLAAGASVLTPQLLEEMLGLPDQTLVVNVVDAVAAGEPRRALPAGAALLDRGVTVDQALELIIDHLRNLLLIRACGADSELVELAAEAREKAAEQAKSFDAAGLVHMIALCDAAARNARNSVVSRALYDAVIARLALAEHFADVGALLERAEPAGAAAGAEPVGGGSKKKQVSDAAPPAPPRPADRSVVVETKARGDRGEEADGPGLWQRVLALAGESASDQALVEHLVFRRLEGRRLRLAADAPGAGLARWLSAQTGALADLVRRATGRRLDVVIEPGAAAEREVAARQRLEEAGRSPLVRRLMEIFDATVVEVQPPAAQTDQAGRSEDV